MKWHLDFCGGTRAAAEILAIFHLASIGKLNLPLSCTTQDIQRHMLVFTSPSSANESLHYMANAGILDTFRLSGADAVSILKAKTPQRLEPGHETCSWCQCETLTLNEHHYPVRKAHGGTKTVRICANCHAEFHYLTDNTFYTPSARTIEAMALNPIPDEVLP
jgi:hypothetical protein